MLATNGLFNLVKEGCKEAVTGKTGHVQLGRKRNCLTRRVLDSYYQLENKGGGFCPLALSKLKWHYKENLWTATMLLMPCLKEQSNNSSLWDRVSSCLKKRIISLLLKKPALELGTPVNYKAVLNLPSWLKWLRTWYSTALDGSDYLNQWSFEPSIHVGLRSLWSPWLMAHDRNWVRHAALYISFNLLAAFDTISHWQGHC